MKPAPAAKGAERLGLLTVGDLLEHLPRDRSQARTIAELAPGEVATVVVEVRSITSRPVRRRGMKPLVEATVADESGVLKATFFNQPWLERKYRPGTRLMLQGKYQARNRFRVQYHAPTGEQTGARGRGRDLSRDGGALDDPDRRAGARAPRRARPTWSSRCRRACAPRAAGPIAPARSRRRTSATRRAGRVRLAFEELLLLQIALLRRRARRREAARAEALDAPGR